VRFGTEKLGAKRSRENYVIKKKTQEGYFVTSMVTLQHIQNPQDTKSTLQRSKASDSFASMNISAA
jgi:hypothetical protein